MSPGPFEDLDRTWLRGFIRLLTPREDVYPVADAEVARRPGVPAS